MGYEGGSQTNAQMQTNAGNITDIPNGNNQFAFDVFAQIGGGQQQNVFFSPWSVYSSIAMAHDGARGKTAQEIQQVMHSPENNSQEKQSFASAYDKFNAEDAGYTLYTANAFWVDNDYPLHDNFTSDINRYYHGTAKNEDFKGAAKAIINSWVAEKTNNKITEIVSDIPPQTPLIITNAAYFKANGLIPLKIT